MLKFYCFITGDEFKNVADETPESKKRIRLFSVSILIPVILWLINSYLLTTQVLEKDVLTGIIVSLVSSVLIFIIEKTIIMSNGSKAIAGFRILLGLTVAAIGSIAFDEVIFKNDIDTQISENKITYVKSKLEERENELSEELQKLESTVKEKEQNWKKAYDEAIGEYDGTIGSRIPGNGPRTSLKLQRTDELKTEYHLVKGELDLQRIKVDSALASFEIQVGNNYNENSILLRIKALFDLIKKDSWMQWIHILFTFLIVLLESIVIIIKIFSKETNYEKKMKLIETIGDKRMKMILENNSPVYDRVIFKGDLKKSSELVQRPVNGMFN